MIIKWAKILLCVLSFFIFPYAEAAQTLRVMTYSAFNIDKKLIERFEQQHDVNVLFLKASDAGEMLNKLILTRGYPVADVVMGIDNVLLGKALEYDILLPYVSTVYPAPDFAQFTPKGYLTAFDYGLVTLNYDKAYFAKHSLPLPTQLMDLVQPRYKDLLVVEDPASSSPGLAFLITTIHSLGEARAWQFWQQLRDNGVEITRDWTQAYYTEFSRHGGKRPLVVGYATSPQAELFYASNPIKESPIGNVNISEGTFLQVEGWGVLKGAKQPVLAKQWIDYMLSEEVQKSVMTHAWMYPIRQDVTPSLQERMTFTGTVTSALPANTIHQWIKRWRAIMIQGKNE